MAPERDDARATRPLTLAAVAVLAGCGSTTTAHAPKSEWRANTRGVVQQLQVDLGDVALGGTTRPAAAHALHDLSTLYALLVAYSDFDGCAKMVAATEAPASVTAKLSAACIDLERASRLFTRAMQTSDPAVLAAATLQARRADPQLVRALASGLH